MCTSKRRTQAIATSVLAALDRAGRDVPRETRVQLEATASGDAENTGAISRAFGLLNQSLSPAVTDHQRQIASALRDEHDQQSFREWLAVQPRTEDDEALGRLELRIAELRLYVGEMATNPFTDRLRQVSEEGASARKAVLFDDLRRP